MNLIIGGDVIACKNKALKSFVLFPRCDRDIQIDLDIDIEKEGRRHMADGQETVRDGVTDRLIVREVE